MLSKTQMATLNTELNKRVRQWNLFDSSATQYQLYKVATSMLPDADDFEKGVLTVIAFSTIHTSTAIEIVQSCMLALMKHGDWNKDPRSDRNIS
jgi:hypothetical protein